MRFTAGCVAACFPLLHFLHWLVAAAADPVAMRSNLKWVGQHLKKWGKGKSRINFLNVKTKLFCTATLISGDSTNGAHKQTNNDGIKRVTGCIDNDDRSF